MRVSLALLSGAAASLEWPLFLKGVLEGAGLEVEAECASGSVTEAKDIEEAIELMKKKDKADIEAGLKLLGEDLKEMPTVLKECKAAEEDIAKFVMFLKTLSDPEKVAIEIGKNVLINGGAIFKEVEDAEKDCKARATSEQCGKDVGTILDKAFGGHPHLQHPQWPTVVKGLLEGMGFTQEVQCYEEAESDAKTLDQAIQLFREHDKEDMKEGFQLMAQALKGLPDVLRDCKAAAAHAEDDAKKLEQALAQIKSPAAFAYHIGKDLLINGKDIFKELMAAEDAYVNAQWEAFGQNLGEAFYKLVVGKGEEEIIV